MDNCKTCHELNCIKCVGEFEIKLQQANDQVEELEFHIKILTESWVADRIKPLEAENAALRADNVVAIEALNQWKLLAHFAETPTDWRTGDSLKDLYTECIQSGEKALSLNSGVAEKDGRLVELPCKVGDTVYAFTGRGIVEARVTEFTINENGVSIIRLYSTDDRIADYQYDNFKKSVFLSKEAAESALKAGDTNEHD